MKGINRQFKMTLLVLLLLFATLFLWHIVKNDHLRKEMERNKPLIAVSTTKVQASTWQPYLYAVGVMDAINGINLSTQVAGNVVKINFKSGQRVKQGDFLIQLDDRVEQAQLENNRAALKLAEITYLRNKVLTEQGAVSKQTSDEATAKYQQAQASVAELQALLSYKHITAPFGGKIGIENISLGQYVKPGDNLVPLQALSPLYVYFYLPEKYVGQLYVNQPIVLTVDSLPKQLFRGKISALNALVDPQTHNMTVQAIIPNQGEKLYPGLFARIKVLLPQRRHVISIPQTAINYTLYGNTVYMVKEEGKNKAGIEMFSVWLRDVSIGEERDNHILITHGLRANECIVSSGQLKLSNGQHVVINNAIQP
jgi:membrane fusion protein, multidrug efflux system